MIKHYLLFLIAFFLTIKFFSQEILQFRVDDFDLNGNVKTCQVITAYGQEIFEFDALGRLVKATTAYNEDDRDVTTYKFNGEHLVEKRVESFKNNEIDLASSMAYFYVMDTTANKVVREQIISYDREFVEAQEYWFDANNELSKIIVSQENAVDEIVIEQTSYKNEHTKTYFENGIIQKSIRKSIKRDRNRGQLEVVLTKNYLDGEPNTADEEVRDSKGLLLSKELFKHDSAENEFASTVKYFYEYDSEMVLKKEITKQGNATVSKVFVFQFDDNEERNWVKKIITPDNTFTTRKIEYYPKPDADIKKPE